MSRSPLEHKRPPTTRMVFCETRQTTVMNQVTNQVKCLAFICGLFSRKLVFRSKWIIEMGLLFSWIILFLIKLCINRNRFLKSNHSATKTIEMYHVASNTICYNDVPKLIIITSILEWIHPKRPLRLTRASSSSRL